MVVFFKNTAVKHEANSVSLDIRNEITVDNAHISFDPYTRSMTFEENEQIKYTATNNNYQTAVLNHSL